MILNEKKYILDISLNNKNNINFYSMMIRFL